MGIAIGAAISASGQTRPNPVPTEEFDLNIANERITEENFFRSTALDLDAGNVTVHVGAAVSASRVDLTLRGVTGHVRFRASLGQLERLFRPTPAREQ